LCLDPSSSIETRVNNTRRMLALLLECTLRADHDQSTKKAGEDLQEGAKRILRKTRVRNEVLRLLRWEDFTSRKKKEFYGQQESLSQGIGIPFSHGMGMPVSQGIPFSHGMGMPLSHGMGMPNFSQGMGMPFTQSSIIPNTQNAGMGMPFTQTNMGMSVPNTPEQRQGAIKPVCTVCGKFGHSETTCFVKHPELRRQTK
jgi:hypothetical protein